MARWTKEGWELLEGIALNAYAFTGFKLSAFKVLEDAKRISALVDSSPRMGNKIRNIFGEERFWHPFHDGKILIWKTEDSGEVIFVGAYYSLPDDIIF